MALFFFNASLLPPKTNLQKRDSTTPGELVPCGFQETAIFSTASNCGHHQQLPDFREFDDILHGLQLWDCKRRVFCVGCDIVQADHAPEAGVAQGIFHGILVRHQGKHQEEVEERLEEEVERRVKGEHSSNQTQVRMHG